jgi:hypothetical protein
MKFAKRERFRHAELRCAVVKVGEEIDCLARKSLLEGRLVDTTERAGGQVTFVVLVE